MSLHDDLAALKDMKPHRFESWLANANPEEAELVTGYIDDVDVPINALLVTLRNHNVPCTRETILKRRGSRS